MVPISRPNGLNIAGACHLDVVDVNDVQTMPVAIACNVLDPVVLKAGKEWSRVQLATPGSRLLEKWIQDKGASISDCTISGTIGKDQLALLPSLWGLPTARFLVLFTGMDEDLLLVGTVNEGCQIAVTDRDRGDENSPVNGYKITFRLRRSVPVPFYQADPPLTPGACPTLGDQLADASVPDIIALLNPTQLAAFEDYFGGECPTLAELLGETAPEELLPLLSTEQVDYIIDEEFGGIDGGDSGDGGGGLIDAADVADAGWTDTNGRYARNDSAATGSVTPAVGSAVYQKGSSTLVLVKDQGSGNWFLYDGDADFGYYMGDSSSNPWEVAAWTSLDPGYDPPPTVVQATA